MREARVTYPQLYSLPSGDLLFIYRDGASGNGDVLLDRYDVRRRAWSVVQHPLIAGEGKRNAYVNQLAIDRHGRWHLSWVWRDSPDVASNHDVMYAHGRGAKLAHVVRRGVHDADHRHDGGGGVGGSAGE